MENQIYGIHSTAEAIKAGQVIGQGTSPNASYTEADLQNGNVVIVDILNFEPDGGCGTGNYPVTLQFTKQ